MTLNSRFALSRRDLLGLTMTGLATAGLGLPMSSALAASQTSPMKKLITESKGYNKDAKLVFADETGKEQTMADYRGRFVLVNVWATWCFSCRTEMPDLDALQGKFDPEKLLVMPLSIDRKGIDAVMPFYDKTGIKNLRIFLSSGVAAVHAFGERGIPFTILLDPDGNEAGRILGPVKWDADDFVAFLNDKIDNWKAS